MWFELSEPELILVNGIGDLLAAYIAHHFAPRLPGPHLAREYLDPFLIPGMSLPLQLAIYHSYVAERPWYVFALLLLVLIMSAGLWLCYRFYSSTSASVIAPGHRVPTHRPRIRRLAKRLLWVLGIAYVSSASLWIYWQFRPPDETTIIVTKFVGPQADYSLTREVVVGLRRAITPGDNITVIPTSAEVSLKDGSDGATRLGTPLIGRRHEATLVIWGSRDESSSTTKIVVSLEPIRVAQLLSHASPRSGYNLDSALPVATYAPFVIPIEHLHQFTFQPRFAEDIRRRSFYILGITRLLSGEFAAAQNYLDKAATDNSGEMLAQVLVSRAFAQIGLAREHSSGTSSGAQLAKELILSAKADCERAISLNNNVGHFCLGQTYLEIGQTMLALLVLAYQQHEPTWSDRILEEDAALDVNKATLECSSAIELMPRSAAYPHGCRAHGNFLLGFRESGLRPAHPPGPKAENYYRRSIEDWGHVIEADPRDFEALRRRGNVFLMLDEYLKADSDFTDSIKLNRSYFGTYFWRGIARGRMNRFDEAVTDFEIATDLDPEFAPGWCGLGRSRGLIGARGAREALRRCQELSGPGTRLWKEAEDQLATLK